MCEAIDRVGDSDKLRVGAQAGRSTRASRILGDRHQRSPALISALCDALGDRGSIVVYYKHFEFERLADLASWLPRFSARIKKIHQRLWDLLPIVRNHVYHPTFGGSYSLKSVLPALVPKMTYEGMEVADGEAAGVAWESLVRGTVDGIGRDRVKKALLDYCRQDTLGMVRLVEKLYRASE